eukprot:augustus_masked-scaffold_127-processed-gene-0.0-mRNA-1 protein AED:0.00 eAED:0.00 QI:0/-1/0/1/-1/1/1/0/444
MSSLNATEIRALIQAEIDGAAAAQSDGDGLWMVLCGALVFFMHAGFAMLEAGSVRQTSVANIMFKNISTISIGALSYWFFGFAFAYGEDSVGSQNDFIGIGNFAGRVGDDVKALWFFQMVFAATAATIVSGAVAGRIKLMGYFIVAVVLTVFVYPVVSHWIWATGGWLSGFTPVEDLFTFEAGETLPCGVLDFAGSGVVHMTGGVAAFWGALILGPRSGWIENKELFRGHNFALATMGTFFLWFGWYGFNCGSTLVWDGVLAGHVAVTTTVSPSAACLIGMVYSRLVEGHWNLTVALNCVLGGLVGITAGCAVINPGLAVLTGVISGLVYVLGSKAVEAINVDDPVGAVAVHGFCGLWGLIAVALFGDSDRIFSVYSSRECDTNVGALLSWQLLGAASIIAWVSAFAILMFAVLKVAGLLKLDADEQKNVDAHEHGAAAYENMS